MHDFPGPRKAKGLSTILERAEGPVEHGGRGALGGGRGALTWYLYHPTGKVWVRNITAVQTYSPKVMVFWVFFLLFSLLGFLKIGSRHERFLRYSKKTLKQRA